MTFFGAHTAYNNNNPKPTFFYYLHESVKERCGSVKFRRNQQKTTFRNFSVLILKLIGAQASPIIIKPIFDSNRVLKSVLLKSSMVNMTIIKKQQPKTKHIFTFFVFFFLSRTKWAIENWYACALMRSTHRQRTEFNCCGGVFVWELLYRYATFHIKINYHSKRKKWRHCF